MKKIGLFYHNLPFGKKLIIWFLVVSVLPAVLIGGYSFRVAVNSARTQYSNSMLTDLRLIEERVQEQLKQVQLRTIRLSCDSEVILMLNSPKSPGNYIDHKVFRFQKLLFDYEITSLLHSVYIFSSDGAWYSNSSSEAALTAMEQFAKSVSGRVEQGENGFWGEPLRLGGEAVLPYVRIIKDYQTGRFLGLVIANYPQRSISDYTKLYSRHEDDILMLNQNGTIASAWDGDIIGESFRQTFAATLDGQTFFEGTKPQSGEKLMLVGYQSPYGTFRYVAAVNSDAVLADGRSIMDMIILLVLLCISGCVLLSVIVSKSVTKPINKLAEIMDHMEGERLHTDFSPLYQDEVGRLARSFNSMTERLQDSIAQMLAAKESQRLAEYRALTAQINPHFLYNTLSSIIYLTNGGYKEEVIRMTAALSSLFRISISKGREMIPIRDELAHVQSYLEIQQIRYQGQIDYAFDVEPALLEELTIKILLQPLVENALYHGIRDSGKEGFIRIVGRKQGDLIWFEIRDSAHMLTAEQAEEINRYLETGDCPNTKWGIGIRNVNDRIRFHFGPPCGVRLERDGDETVSRVLIQSVGKWVQTEEEH